eukprot:Seg3488.1 transcript_id=Seg3488.1/GoldUCD/mRNA.D3Y31 product="Apoptosis regulator BAX" protein_id=Seg3488.1/GoldUCD/D3Y31
MGPPVDRSYQPPRDERPAQRSDDNAEREDEFDETDSPGHPRSVRRRTYERSVFQRNVSTVDEVMDQATGYVTSFMADRLDEDGFNVPEDMMHIRRRVNSDTARCLRQIGDDLVNNVELNTLLDNVTITKDTAFETFASIAAQIFSDGVINWGRVVALFYFGYKMVIKVLFDGGLLKTVIKWILRFISERLVQWIAQAGGWAACKSYFGSTNAQLVGVFLAGCALTALVFWLKK